MQYASEKDLDYRNFALTRQDPYATFNANLIYTTPDERWTVELWGRNLGDEAYLVAAAPNTTDFNTGTGVLGTPRTYGVRLSAQF
jgi:iron complex outermembrane receptor protein